MGRKESNRIVGVWLIGTAVLLIGGSAWAKPLTCLTGTDPVVAGDVAQIEAARAEIDSTCLCAEFDGTVKGKKHGDYLKCVSTILDTRIGAMALRSQCKRTVKGYYAKSVCGFNQNLHKVACIKKTLAVPPKVTCAIKNTTKADGVTPNDQCIDKPGRFDQTACPDSICVDAADTTGNLVIDGSDSGDCFACSPGTANCNSARSDGCETTVGTDVNNCGGCGNVCPGTGETCVDGRCGPLTLQFGDTAGGTAFSDSCSTLGALHGVDVWIESGHITQIRGHCLEWGIGGASSIVNLPVRGSAGGGAVMQTLECPAASTSTSYQSVVGFAGLSDATQLIALAIRCAETAVQYSTSGSNVTLTGYSTGPATTLAASGGTGGSVITDTDCQDGTTGLGFAGRVGPGLLALGLRCAVPPWTSFLNLSLPQTLLGCS